MATRVFELARELGVRSKDVLDKCRAEGLEIKNHMSAVSAGLEATIREWFSEPDAGGTAVELTAHVDLKTARAEAERTRRRKKAEEEEAAAEEAERKKEAEEEAEAEEEEVDIAAEAPAPEETQAVTAPEPTVATEAAPVQVPMFEGAEAVVPAEPPETAEAALVAEAPSEQIEAPAGPEAQEQEAEAAAPEEEKPAGPPAPEVIKAAGPQVVPRPATLRGPRVVRMERPDNIAAPPPRRAPSAGQPGRTVPVAPGADRKVTGRGAPTDDAAGKKKARRRSPRRRSGRSADSGEKLKEWRDQDLAERSQRLAAASGGHRRHRASQGRARPAGGGVAITGQVPIDEPITIKALSAATGIKSAEIIKKLFALGVMATVNQVIDQGSAETVIADYGIELAVQHAKTAEEELLEGLQSRPGGKTKPRAPVVTFLGHVDHGKTSLLDHIRQTSVAEGEAGGITQHIGAYRHDDGDKHVVFLDTPGHEAFTAMRARGANMTDIVVLVVAADDGVMPQTVEAINHAKAAGVPIVVALNKVDLPNANVQRAMGQLAEYDLQPQEWGGEVEVIHTSAATGEGIDTLVETLSLEAELLELAASSEDPAQGFVIEAEMNPGLGTVARLLVTNGSLHIGDVLLAGRSYGRVRQMVDSHGRTITEAGPSTPVEVSGLDEVPNAGDKFFVAEGIDQARTVAEDRRQRARAAALTGGQRVTLENLFSQIEAGEATEVAVILKADVQGSIEALAASLSKLSTDEVRLEIIHKAVGGISTGDITLAEASNAIIIGFNVVPDASARQLGESTGVDVRLYRVIYEAIEDVRKAMEEGLAPEVKEETLGHADVRQIFKISRIGTIAGCYVTDGVAQRNARVRILRDNIVIEDGRALDSLKRVKDDVREVRAGMECGLKVAGYDDIKEGDALEFYQRVEVARKL